MQLRTRIVVTVGIIMTLGLLPLLAAGETGEHAFGTPEFQEVWERNDLPIDQGVDSRTWLWGPHANTPVLQEPYEEADGGMRDVQYTDKSRMEMPVHPVDPDSDWFITQGLLATELMTGNMQLGDATFVQHDPSDAYVAGDPANNQSPTYAQMGELIDEPSRAGGEVITEMIQSDGNITSDPGLAGHGVTDAQHVGQTDNNIASVFWDFMNSSGTIYHDGQFGEGPVFTNPFYAIGFPITEAYWGHVTVDETPQMVLMQCFERRCLTFTPDNDPAWQVESGNIGQHYYDWRYGMPHYPDDDDPPVSDDTPPAADDTDDGASDDDPPPQDPEPTSASPEVVHDSRYIDEDHIIEVTVLSGTDPYQGAEVRAEVTSSTGDQQEHVGTQLTPDPATTGEDGVATLGYVGVESGIDTVTISVDGLTQTETVTVTWNDDELDQSIQAAIDAAEPGDTVYVETGVHSEGLSISESEITLIGETGAVLDGTGLDVSTGIQSSGEEVHIEGLKIRNFEEYGIHLNDMNGATIVDLEVLDNESIGISVEHSSDVEIDNVMVSAHGVEISGSSPVGIHSRASRNVDINSSEVRGVYNGIRVSQAGVNDPVKSSGSIFDNVIESEYAGISISGGEDVYATHNQITAGDRGIYLYSSGGGNIQLHHNQFSDESDESRYGIVINGGLEAQITENHFTGLRTGLYVNSGAAEVTNNRFAENGVGIRTGPIADGSLVQVTENDILDHNFGVDVMNVQDGSVMNARFNYWGSSDGPGGEGPGTGDTISEHVNADYWHDEIVNPGLAP